MLNAQTLSTATLPSCAESVMPIVKHAQTQLLTAHHVSKTATSLSCQSLSV